jgi:hypothetical protein
MNTLDRPGPPSRRRAAALAGLPQFPFGYEGTIYPRQPGGHPRTPPKAGDYRVRPELTLKRPEQVRQAWHCSPVA